MWKSDTNNKPTAAAAPAVATAVMPEPTPQPAAYQPVATAPLVPAAPIKSNGSSLVIKGELSGSEDLAIEGRVEGKISLPEHVLTIGLGAKVSAEITARVVIVHGAVTGNVNASERVEIKHTGRMDGDLVSPKVQMSDGATFSGRLETRNPAKAHAGVKSSARPELVAV